MSEHKFKPGDVVGYLVRLNDVGHYKIVTTDLIQSALNENYAWKERWEKFKAILESYRSDEWGHNIFDLLDEMAALEFLNGEDGK